MVKDSQITYIPPAEWFVLNQSLQELSQISAPCISVYYPYGKEQETIELLDQKKRSEQLEKIEEKVTKRIQYLKENPKTAGRFTKTLCVFGWIQNGKVSTKEIGTSQKLPYLYLAGKRPYTKPFSDILKTSLSVILVTIDQKSARIQKFHGTQIVDEESLKINLHGRHKKGGQSQGRFLRARQTTIHVFFKDVADRLKKMDKGSQLILIGGSGNAKMKFLDEIDSGLVGKCRLVNDVSFSTSKNIVYKKIIEQLYLHRKKRMMQIIAKYEDLVKDGLTAKKNDVIYTALERGAVDTLIVSAQYHTCPQFKKILDMLEMAANTQATIEFATSPKIIEKLKIDQSVLAILRYKIR